MQPQRKSDDQKGFNFAPNALCGHKATSHNRITRGDAHSVVLTKNSHPMGKSDRMPLRLLCGGLTAMQLTYWEDISKVRPSRLPLSTSSRTRDRTTSTQIVQMSSSAISALNNTQTSTKIPALSFSASALHSSPSPHSFAGKISQKHHHKQSYPSVLWTATTTLRMRTSPRHLP
jgi:hypothetical protein